MKNVKIIDLSDAKNYGQKEHLNADILFFSDEWLNRKDQCKSFINAANGEFTNVVYARKCKIKEISKGVAKDFLEQYHIQGPNNLSLIYFGILFKEELLGIMSLGRHSRQISQNRIVLDRLCFKKETIVIGGSSKLFKVCIQWSKKLNYKEIISFSDNRWTKGDIYKQLGFSLEKQYAPDYSYVDIANPSVRISKQSQKKSSTNCPANLTEYEWSKLRGLERIWDKGKIRWVYLLDPSAKSWKEKLSEKCAKQHASGSFKHSHIRGYFESEKNNKDIYYSSSYELRCMYLLEQDENVISFDRAIAFKDCENRWRNPDLKVIYSNKTIIVEIKPQKRLNEPEVTKQIEASATWAKSNNWEFVVWTECDAKLKNDQAIINWSKKYIKETTGDEKWIERQKNNSRKRANKHYQTKIAKDKINIFCKFCQKVHNILRISYNKNLTHNGRYICGQENGCLVGKKPGKKKINPYAHQGKKQCNKCKEIKLFKDFSPDKTKSDAMSTRCKTCRAEIYKERYRLNNENS